MHISPRPQRCSFQLSLCSLSVQDSNAFFGISVMIDGIDVMFGLSDVALTGFPCLSDSCVVEAESVDVAEFSGMTGIWDPVMMSCCLSLVVWGWAEDVSVL